MEQPNIVDRWCCNKESALWNQKDGHSLEHRIVISADKSRISANKPARAGGPGRGRGIGGCRIGGTDGRLSASRFIQRSSLHFLLDYIYSHSIDTR